MGTYNSVQLAANQPMAVHGDAAEVQTARFVLNTTAVLTTADILNFGYMPLGARLVGGYLTATDLDASTGLTINIGDAGSATRLFNASTLGQAGGNAALPVAALDYQYTAKTLITGSIGANATTTASGQLVLSLQYVVEDPAST